LKCHKANDKHVSKEMEVYNDDSSLSLKESGHHQACPDCRMHDEYMTTNSRRSRTSNARSRRSHCTQTGTIPGDPFDMVKGDPEDNEFQ
jgi:hypothetical protein